jgi:hypothetical protein
MQGVLVGALKRNVLPIPADPDLKKLPRDRRKHDKLPQA